MREINTQAAGTALVSSFSCCGFKKASGLGLLSRQRLKVRWTLSPALTLTSCVCCWDSGARAVTAYVPGETSTKKSSSDDDRPRWEESDMSNRHSWNSKITQLISLRDVLERSVCSLVCLLCECVGSFARFLFEEIFLQGMFWRHVGHLTVTNTFPPYFNIVTPWVRYYPVADICCKPLHFVYY